MQMRIVLPRPRHPSVSSPILFSSIRVKGREAALHLTQLALRPGPDAAVRVLLFPLIQKFTAWLEKLPTNGLGCAIGRKDRRNPQACDFSKDCHGTEANKVCSRSVQVVPFPSDSRSLRSQEALADFGHLVNSSDVVRPGTARQVDLPTSLPLLLSGKLNPLARSPFPVRLPNPSALPVSLLTTKRASTTTLEHPQALLHPTDVGLKSCSLIDDMPFTNPSQVESALIIHWRPQADTTFL
jgi:hypothetical protein